LRVKEIWNSKYLVLLFQIIMEGRSKFFEIGRDHIRCDLYCEGKNSINDNEGMPVCEVLLAPTRSGGRGGESGKVVMGTHVSQMRICQQLSEERGQAYLN
jgi:hypothetical protein